MAQITISFENEQIATLLNQLEQAGRNLEPVMKNIGEILLNSSRQRFQTSTAPSGEKWEVNSPVTLANKRDNRPLIGETKSLSTQIHYDANSDHVIVGSLMEYAGTQQFGASKGQYGTTKYGVSVPWGNIPARPFLGISTDDENDIIALLSDYLEQAAEF